MVHLRIVAPEPLASGVLDVLERSPAVLNVVHLPGAARRPTGDAILCDVPREHASLLLGELRKLGIEESGTIAVETGESALGQLAHRATEIARGAPADAVVWEEVEERTSESAELSGSFVAFMVIATLIAAVGILTDSLILIIGAMVVGPEFGPLAGVCVAVVQRRLPLARRSLVALGVGFGAAIGATVLGTLILRAVGTAPGRAERRAPSRDALHLRAEHVVGHRRGAGRRRGRPLADDREVRRADRRPDLGDHDSRGRQRRVWQRRTRTGASSPGRSSSS